jgi:hypothetical protein
MTVTMDGKAGVDLLRPAAAVGTHHDYPVFRSPLADFLAETRRHPPDTRILQVAPRGDPPLPLI